MKIINRKNILMAINILVYSLYIILGGLGYIALGFWLNEKINGPVGFLSGRDEVIPSGTIALMLFALIFLILILASAFAIDSFKKLLSSLKIQLPIYVIVVIIKVLLEQDIGTHYFNLYSITSLFFGVIFPEPSGIVANVVIGTVWLLVEILALQALGVLIGKPFRKLRKRKQEKKQTKNKDALPA